jgi:Protein of unknown function (DUF3618)
MTRPSADRLEPARPSPNGHGPANGGDQAPSPDALRAEIAQTRAALADTAEALAERFDVPTRVKARLRHSRILHDRPTRIAAVVAVVGTVVAIWALRQRR